jgi:hypothetical protein
MAYRSRLIKTPDRISERPPRGGLSVCAGHFAFVRFWTKADIRLILAGGGLSAYDPTATLAAHCGNRFGAVFSPYQSTRLSR